MATLPGAWRYSVSVGTGWPGVSILQFGEVKSLFAASTLVWQHVQLSEQIRPRDTLAYFWDEQQILVAESFESLYKIGEEG